MSHCKNCVHWKDESIAAIATSQDGNEHIFMGCTLHGHIEHLSDREDCPDFVEDDNLFVICDTCRITVPKVCVSLGECVNCTDTDLYCVESCIGGESRKYCTHFVRLYSQGVQLIDADKQEVFDIFPTLDMPGAGKTATSPLAAGARTFAASPQRGGGKGKNVLHQKSNR